MARINLERRAEIGQEKRARTRAQLVSAARALFSMRSLASVTIDDLVRSPRSTSSSSPYAPPRATRCSGRARGCDAFIVKALQDPAWGSLVARMARADPTIGETARTRLREDLMSEALKETPRPGFSVELALEAVVGILLQVLAAIGAGRLSHENRADAVGAVLGALGAGKREAASIRVKLERMRATHLRLTEDESWGASGAGGTRASKA